MHYDPWAWMDRRVERAETAAVEARSTATEARSTAHEALRKSKDLCPRLEKLERDRQTLWIAARVIAAFVLLTSSLTPERTAAVLKALIEAITR